MRFKVQLLTGETLEFEADVLMDTSNSILLRRTSRAPTETVAVFPLASIAGVWEANAKRSSDASIPGQANRSALTD